MKATLAALVAAVVLGAPIGLAQGQQAEPDPKLVEAGKKLYADKGCAKCHQIDGQGNRMFPLDGIASKLTKEDLRMWLTNPEEMMAKLPRRPVMRMPKVELQPAELDAMVAYLQTLKAK